MSIDVKLGDVFYKIERTDFKNCYRPCRVCEGKKELVVNGVSFKCPMCNKEQATLKVNGFMVRRYRLFSIEHFIGSEDWKYNGEEPDVRYQLYHKSGKGYFFATHKTAKIASYMFSGKSHYFNCPDPNEYSVEKCLYSDYKLAVSVANKLTEEQINKVRTYNEVNNTDYELPVFNIEHDKKSK